MPESAADRQTIDGKPSLPVCECGDWKHQHEGMKGRCLLGSACTPAPCCSKYRYSRHETAEQIHLEAYEEALERALKET